MVSPMELTYSVGVWPIWHTTIGILAHCKLPVYRNLGTVHFTEDHVQAVTALSLSVAAQFHDLLSFPHQAPDRHQ
jgi:hypothetical protein